MLVSFGMGDQLEPPVIPAKAGIQSDDSTFPKVCGVDSRFRGNDYGLERPCLANDTSTRVREIFVQAGGIKNSVVCTARDSRAAPAPRLSNTGDPLATATGLARTRLDLALRGGRVYVTGRPENESGRPR